MDDDEEVTQQEHSMNQILTEIGFGKVHVWILFTCGLFAMHTACETMGIAIIAPLLDCEFLLNESKHSFLNASGFVGMALSAYFWCFFCDKYGRRRILITSIMFSTPISVASMLMPEYYSFLVFRVFVGMCTAGPSFMTMTYLSEFCQESHIGMMSTVLSFFNGIGVFYFVGTAAALSQYEIKVNLHGDYTFTNWRLLGCLYTLPGICGVLLILKLPETPKFLMMQYETDECLQVLQWMYRQNNGDDLRNNQAKKLKTDTPSLVKLRERAHHVKLCTGFHKLLAWYYLKRLLPACIMQFGIFLIANGMGLWLTSFRNHAIDRCTDLSNICCKHEEMRECDGLMFDISLYLAACLMFICVILAISIHYIKRRITFCIALFIASLWGYVLPFIYNATISVVLIVLFLATIQGVTNLLGSGIIEFVPTVLRAKAIAMCYISGRLGVISGVLFLGHALGAHCMLSFLVMATFSCFNTVAAIIVGSGVVFF